MKLIKLNAIDSTNDFLKRIQQEDAIENWTVVTALSQTSGKGQMGAKWLSEEGKNLIMSILVKVLQIETHQIFNLNVIVSLSIIEVLEKFDLPNLAIKWPNDIMSANKKIGGILIENTIKSNKEIISIIGIGLNVNQTNFDNLPKASSLSKICNKEFDIQLLLKSIFEAIQSNFLKLSKSEIDGLWTAYNQMLFKKGIPTVFQDTIGNQFMALVQSVDFDGKLLLMLENDDLVAFEVKEIGMLY